MSHSFVRRPRPRHAPLPALRRPSAAPSRPASRRGPRGVLDPDLLRSALPHAFRKLDPRLLIKNPVMFVVEITAVLVTLIAHRQRDRRPAGDRRRRPRLPGPDRDLALVHGPVRDLRRGRRRGARPGPGRDAAARPARRRSPIAAAPTARSRTSARPSCARATSSSSRRARRSPATATSSRASAYVNEAAITGESAPGPQGARHGHPELGHRRHDAGQRPARRSASRPTRARRSSTG